MKIECGTDIIEIARIEEAIADGGRAFLDRVFTPAEQAYCEGRKVARYASYAARFAAKEAVAKTFGTGMSGVDFNEIEVVNDASGKPAIALHGRAAALLAGFGGATLSISLSHSKNYATAVAVLTVS